VSLAPDSHEKYSKVNILIDHGGNAVLCDFGLSHVKEDIASCTSAIDAPSIAGSRNWMAPERLNGSPLRKPCDIYAFGMVIYEVSYNSFQIPVEWLIDGLNQIQTNETPLPILAFGSFIDCIEHVVGRNLRPQRPEADEAPQMTDALWRLAERCWVAKSIARPNANTVCDAIYHELSITGMGNHESPMCVHYGFCWDTPAQNLLFIRKNESPQASASVQTNMMSDMYVPC
jgi:serine/threonine protein kinase